MPGCCARRSGRPGAHDSRSAAHEWGDRERICCAGAGLIWPIRSRPTAPRICSVPCMFRLPTELIRVTTAGVLGCVLCGMPAAPAQAKGNSSGSTGPALVNACVVTENVRRLVEFYEPILQLKAKWSGNDYAEFATGLGVLSIFSASAQENYIPGSAEGAKNRSLILEFKVADADAEYRRLKGLVKTWVKLPTTQPWGTRSIYFRDPDGNLVDFYSPASACISGLSLRRRRDRWCRAVRLSKIASGRDGIDQACRDD